MVASVKRPSSVPAAAAVGGKSTGKKAKTWIPPIPEPAPQPGPLEPPPFTVGDLRRAVGKKGFERSLLRSLGWLAYDLALIAALYAVTPLLTSLPAAVQTVAWPVWWIAQGCVMTGLWVLAHECGHYALFDSERLCDVIGCLAHSVLLVPYHNWRVTHGKHHQNTGHVLNDEVFLPYVKSEVAREMMNEAPIYQLFMIVNMLLFGWPGYLIFNAAGSNKYKGKAPNHFLPSSPLFSASDYFGIVSSNIVLLTWIAFLTAVGYQFGFAALFKYYLAPYLVVNHNLVLITFLQHTDVYLPHYNDDGWSWLRGALATVDRSFGSVLDFTFHGINDTHVCHHIFSRMPFYKAAEATEAIKAVIKSYYLYDPTPIWPATWRAYTNCKFVDDEGDALFYHKRLGDE
eukprot:PLAT9812.1.p2 GENE.PLAT9812.1~~PLAT9812.1.p2  ORF type:complete len:419 (-),score=208.63 PLAT9812.1:75-1274(-)